MKALLLLWLLGADPNLADYIIISSEVSEPNRPSYCGKGPVIIKVNRAASCKHDTCFCEPPRKLGDSDVYMEGTCYCHLIACFEEVEEKWTDYPECGGKKL